MRRPIRNTAVFGCLATIAALTVTPAIRSQEVPVSSFKITAPADSNTYTGVLVGGNPFSKTPAATTIDAVLVPLIVEVVQGSDVLMFDPTSPNYCGPNAGVSPVDRFRKSPLVVARNLSFNGVNVGKWQYVPAEKRAEFWHMPGGQLLADTIHWTFAAPMTLPSAKSKGATVKVDASTGCEYAELVNGAISKTITNSLIPQLQKSGTISTSTFVLFMTVDVVQLKSDGTCCNNGDHGAILSSPPQTFGWAQYDSHGGTDIKGLTHEIAEWMNNPFYSNLTPAWGFIGEAATDCVDHLEVGDPMNTDVVPYTSPDGFVYHPQELAFFGWFFDQPGGGKLYGTGGKYSSNGTFIGAHNTCPPGGSFPPTL